jgi:hypothetical protein
MPGRLGEGRLARRAGDRVRYAPLAVAARTVAAVLSAAVLSAMFSGCSAARWGAASCEPTERLALVAQSVPSASYLPCVASLPEGWRVTASRVERGATRLSLLSDRAQGRAVHVELLRACDVSGATATSARAEGARTYLRLSSISPRYAGVLTDVFPGGCVRYRFDFERGPHIVLFDQLETAIGLYSRNQLRLELRRRLGIELDA